NRFMFATFGKIADRSAPVGANTRYDEAAATRTAAQSAIGAAGVSSITMVVMINIGMELRIPMPSDLPTTSSFSEIGLISESVRPAPSVAKTLSRKRWGASSANVAPAYAKIGP